MSLPQDFGHEGDENDCRRCSAAAADDAVVVAGGGPAAATAAGDAESELSGDSGSCDSRYDPSDGRLY
jgi:hypothetical protein